MTTRNRKPQWWQLYVGVVALGALAVPETRATLTATGHIFAELGILALIVGFVRMWLRTNRSALMQIGEEPGGWGVNPHEFPAMPPRDLEELKDRPAPRRTFVGQSPARAAVSGDALGWIVAEDQKSVFANGGATARKEQEW